MHSTGEYIGFVGERQYGFKLIVEKEPCPAYEAKAQKFLSYMLRTQPAWGIIVPGEPIPKISTWGLYDLVGELCLT